ncbi:RING finger protein [Quillaja saponaria]|uniref:RING finger protein n=1 Tax=Quillaja saponaria TaxID=32244 RepID=A0AAD7L9M5_QUISA|nr:RING finger protein [Quillaja saponaria]KAJ7954170.1 RING finger protein [Quillaja saponaria]
MGLGNQLNDVACDSIPLLLIALIANCISHLHGFLLGLFKSLGLTRLDPEHVADDRLFNVSGSGNILSEQLNLNLELSYKYDAVVSGESDCVVCLTTLRDGDQVRKLDCQHVFHRQCLDGWLHHHNFNCPLCRSPLVFNGRRERLRRWFSFR